MTEWLHRFSLLMVQVLHWMLVVSRLAPGISDLQLWRAAALPRAALQHALRKLKFSMTALQVQTAGRAC